MKTLFITQHFLDNNGGGCFASRAFINAFAELSTQMTLLYPENGNSIQEFIDSRIETIGINNKTTNLGKIIDVYRGRIHRYSNIFPKKLKETNPDLVVFDNSRTSAGLIKKVNKMGIKIITIHHNYEMQYYLGTQPHWSYKNAFLHYMRKTEHDAVMYSTLNLTLTSEDIDLLIKNYDSSRKSQFKRIGCFEYKKCKQIKTTKVNGLKDNKLIFVITGNLSSFQTEASLIPFLQNYYPTIEKEYPKSKLILAGRNPSNKIQEICRLKSNIQLIPNPAKMEEIINKGHIYICPVNIGGGLKLRIMDGLKVGLPVISHVVSARGYDDFAKENCLFDYNNPESFLYALNKVVDLLQNKKLDKNIIQNIYNANFSFLSGINRLNDLLTINN